jgi:hypothetical protein
MILMRSSSTSNLDTMNRYPGGQPEEMDMVRKRGKHWYTDFPFEGERIRQKTGQTTKMAAEEIAIELLKSLRAEKLAQANPTIQVEVPAPQLALPLTLTEFAEQYFLPWVESHTKIRASSKAGYRYGWSMLASQGLAKMKMADITKSDLDGLKLEWDPRRRRGTKVVWLPLKDRDPKQPWVPVSPSTHNCALRTLSRMFTLAVEKKKVPSATRSLYAGRRSGPNWDRALRLEWERPCYKANAGVHCRRASTPFSTGACVLRRLQICKFQRSISLSTRFMYRTARR